MHSMAPAYEDATLDRKRVLDTEVWLSLPPLKPPPYRAVLLLKDEELTVIVPKST